MCPGSIQTLPGLHCGMLGLATISNGLAKHGRPQQGEDLRGGGQGWPHPARYCGPTRGVSASHPLSQAGSWGGGKGLQAPAKPRLSFPPGERL